MKTQLNRTQRLSTLTALAAVAIVVAIVMAPALGRAEHRYPQQQMQCATQRLHDAADRLNQVAQHCSPTRTEKVFAGILLKKTCRLADGVRECKSWGRVNGDYHSVRGFMRVIENRIKRYCRSELDFHWRAAWADVQREFAQVCYIWDNRDAICAGHLQCPPNRGWGDPRFDGRNQGIYIQPRTQPRFDDRHFDDRRFDDRRFDSRLNQPRFDERRLYDNRSPDPRFELQSHHGHGNSFSVDARTALVNSLLRSLLD